MKLLYLFVGLALCVSAATPAATDPESEELNRALEEAGSSPVDFVRALENHLAQYPNTARRAEIERGLVRGATDAKDYKRVALYGERVLTRDPNDMEVLQQVANAELKSGSNDDARKALIHAQVLESLLTATAKEARESADRGPQATRRIIEIDVHLATAVLLEARALGMLGDPVKAAELAKRSFEVSPSGDAAREAGYWYNEQGKFADAVRWLADAFSLTDPRTTETDRNRDREKLGEIYTKWKGSDAGLGDIVLASWDRNREMIAQRRLMLRQFDPNMQIADPMDFTLTGVDGSKLTLSSLKGKVIVLDFWATWCGPCRVQHPLYDQVREKFRGRGDVVFLAINTDEDHAVVPAFLASNKWDSKAYYEGGLSILLKVTSIPTTIVFDGQGRVASRMTGFDPDRFVATLSERIQAALKAGSTTARARP